ncbi:MAG: chorismate synthase [Thermosediminibacterales bacterium]|nr:chorismate synthase [Thermosediminibacterales bacterium]MDK2835726.1 chorismate synthase [Thermosediminibacterales bacterium]
MLRYLSGGESHGKALMAIIEGLPSNLTIDTSKIDADLARRQQGYGRGGRMKIEKDHVEVLSGLIKNRTTGSPLTLMIKNLDWENWKDKTPPVFTRPRPGHGDLAGALKYNHNDIRNVLERASARETAIRVAVGGVAKQLLEVLGITVTGKVLEVGGADKEDDIKKTIDKVRSEGDSLGGIFQITAEGVPPGLGSHVHWDRKLDAHLAFGLMSIQAVKGVEIGLGFKSAGLPGSKVHDEIFYDKQRGFYRETNNAGGIEAGISNGSPIVVKAAMKPIPTLRKPLRSVDIKTKQPIAAGIERSDVSAVYAASVVGEAVVAWVLAQAVTEKFGGDSLEELVSNFENYIKHLRNR